MDIENLEKNWRTATLGDLEEQWRRAKEEPTRGEIRNYPKIHEGKAWFEPKGKAEDAQWVRRLKHQRVFYGMVNPKDRGFFYACQNACQNSDTKTLKSWLNPGENEQEKQEFMRYQGEELCNVFRAHLQCALAVCEHAHFLLGETAAERLLSIANETQQPLPLLHDLAWQFFPEQYRKDASPPRLGAGIVEATGLLIENYGQEDQEKGVVAALRLEALPILNGQTAAQLYPSPELAFVRRDDAFRTSEKDAGTFLLNEGLWPQAFDVRWRLERRDTHSPIIALTGPSMGLTFTMGIAKLMDLAKGAF